MELVNIFFVQKAVIEHDISSLADRKTITLPASSISPYALLLELLTQSLIYP